MAFTPCAFHGKGYAGGASTFFLRLTSGGTTVGGKLQVCANCATDVLDYLAAHFQKVSEGETFFEHAEPHSCSSCGGSLPEDRIAFYGNAYPRGMRESQWYGQVCAACINAITEDLHLDAAAQRAS